MEVDVSKNEVSVKAPDASAFWAFLESNGGIPVEDGQVLRAKYDKNKYKFEFDDFGDLEKVSGDVLTLLCTATDANWFGRSNPANEHGHVIVRPGFIWRI